MLDGDLDLKLCRSVPCNSVRRSTGRTHPRSNPADVNVMFSGKSKIKLQYNAIHTCALNS